MKWQEKYNRNQQINKIKIAYNQAAASICNMEERDPKKAYVNL